jgi:hypothetical protein
MSKSVIWSTMVFVVFAFAALMVFFWVRDGSLREAGGSMDHLLGQAGHDVAQGTEQVVGATGNAITKATDGDDRT